MEKYRTNLMPRIGVTYETIKHTALKLLSQGSAPSVQKIREVLGTGSNSTIAEHLKMWREEYASKEIHHLPANIPKELISAMEVLWQTAMTQATEQLIAVKTDLNDQQEKLHAEKLSMEQVILDLRASFSEAVKTIELKTNQIQIMQSEIAVANEKLKYKSQELIDIENRYKSLLDHAYDEKNSVILKSENLQSEIARLQQQSTDETKKYQSLLNEERVLQEQSEIRFMKLIDQARTETIEQRKRYEAAAVNQNKKIESLQSSLSNLEQKQTLQQATLDQKNMRISELSDHNNQAQEKYHDAMTTIAVLQERLNHAANQSQKLKNKKQLKAVG